MMDAYTERADRVPVHIPVTYRVPGNEAWLQSLAENISESGVLFGPTTLSPGTPVEVILFTPMQLGSLGPGKLRCVGEVVRATESGLVGARFEECRFLMER
jgi:hypothetical protein